MRRYRPPRTLPISAKSLLPSCRVALGRPHRSVPTARARRAGHGVQTLRDGLTVTLRTDPGTGPATDPRSVRRRRAALQLEALEVLAELAAEFGPGEGELDRRLELLGSPAPADASRVGGRTGARIGAQRHGEAVAERLNPVAGAASACGRYATMRAPEGHATRWEKRFGGDRQRPGRAVSAHGAARAGRHGDDLPGARRAARPRRRGQDPSTRVRPGPRLRRALPPARRSRRPR